MKGTLSKTKLSRIVICTLMVASILQITAISMVQATSESVDDTVTRTVSAEDFVRIDNDNQVDFVKPEDGSDIGITTIAEPLEILPNTEEGTTTEEQTVDFVRPEDGALIGITEVGTLPKNGEFISTDDQPLDLVKPEEDSDLGINLISEQENSQPLIAPKTTSETGSPLVGGAVILGVVGAIGAVFVAVSHKKTK